MKSIDREGTTRRKFMGRVIGAISGIVGVSLLVPFVGYVVGPALRKRKVELDKAGFISDLVLDHPKDMQIIVEVKDGWRKTTLVRTVWVVQKQTGELRVYNPLCTHLGCAYRWDKKDSLFKCPCHGGVYDIDGKVLAGPPPRPLDMLDYEIQSNNLFVQYQDFKAGSSKKIPL